MAVTGVICSAMTEAGPMDAAMTGSGECEGVGSRELSPQLLPEPLPSSSDASERGSGDDADDERDDGDSG